ncbi:MAG: hypothetical protein SWX82_11175 [Cyanobacteriota bacterium]|nr:hypothetical protein [Cyanobacteriota bacterium]
MRILRDCSDRGAWWSAVWPKADKPLDIAKDARSYENQNDNHSVKL